MLNLHALKKIKSDLQVIPLIVIIAVLPGCSGDRIHRMANEAYSMDVQSDGAVMITAGKSAPRRFAPEFTILISETDPDRTMRWGEFKDPNIRSTYNVWTWGRDTLSLQDSSAHVEDGYNPETDRAYGPGRTANYFHAAPSNTITATAFKIEDDRLMLTFPEHPFYTLSAILELPEGIAAPLLNFSFVPKRDGWYSVGYTGAPEADLESVDELWQPLIWNEKRFPDNSYLTDAFRCPLPTTLVNEEGTTCGVLADPSELPFEYEMPRPHNTQFGVLVRNEDGKAQPMLFAPVLGGPKSEMSADTLFSFTMQLVVHSGNTVDAFEHIARTTYAFRDYRQNHSASLNQVLDNTIEYGMHEASQFKSELRGSNYATDVPGAVKNVSPLHPLSVALVTDDMKIYQLRALPMIEFGLSREKFLFMTRPGTATQNPSWHMRGPGIPLSDLTALYLMSGKRTPIFLKNAEDLYSRERALNLDAVVSEMRWQNALALYRATGKQEWLDKATADANEYLEQRVYVPRTHFKNYQGWKMFFWQAYVPRWAELYELFEETRNEQYLSAARAGARAYTRFLYFCPIVPKGEIVANQGGLAPRYRPDLERYPPIVIAEETVPNWLVSEIGLGGEAAPTSTGPRGILNAHYAPWMLRIARDAGDDFLHDVGRSAVIGRYANFPGYHMNTARTTVYQKPNFPFYSYAQLNGTTSMHFNHIWPFMSFAIDYLVSDVYYRSDARIDFPSRYAEGYAYMQSKVYGDRPGRFYDDENVWLWMPKGVMQSGHVQVNYVTARGDEHFYIALTNQSSDSIATTVALNSKVVPFQRDHSYEVRVWQGNRQVENATLIDGKLEVNVAPMGITALAIEGIRIKPAFQHKIGGGAPFSSQSYASLAYGGTHAMILSMGQELTTSYVYLQSTFEEFDEVRLNYKNGNNWITIADTSYPFEYTVALNEGDAFEFFIEGVDLDGNTSRSKVTVLKP